MASKPRNDLAIFSRLSCLQNGDIGLLCVVIAAHVMPRKSITGLQQLADCQTMSDWAACCVTVMSLTAP